VNKLQVMSFLDAETMMCLLEEACGAKAFDLYELDISTLTFVGNRCLILPDAILVFRPLQPLASTLHVGLNQ